MNPRDAGARKGDGAAAEITRPATTSFRRRPVRPRIRLLAAPVLLGLVFIAGAGLTAGAGVGAYTPRVLMVDNDGGFTPGDPGTGQWGFSPAHITVMQGETIVFDNPAGNFRPHTVTSITWSGTAPTRTLESGTRFDSSPTRDALVTPGGSFALSTAELEAGH